LWIFPVGDYLKPGINDIEIHFASTFPYIEKKQKEHPIPVHRNGPRLPGENWMRKAQCNYGWDWGPVCVTAGIWRPINLVAFSTARIEDVEVRQNHERQNGVGVEVNVNTRRIDDSPLTALAEIIFNDRPVAANKFEIKEGKGSAELLIEHPRLWWPNNMGEQPLYEVRVKLLDAEGVVLDQRLKHIGLRTLKLRRQKDQWGESFDFEVNGVPFFAKGSNWIPADTFTPRAKREDFYRLIRDMREANMNMVRVWGGGIYEEDAFYDACDELGICVWQDFMFACAAYPTFDEDYMESVKQEARDNIKRIRHHASLALWCGNNELEQFVVQGDEWTERTMPWSAYKPLFDELLPDQVKELCPDVDYWPSSAHSPYGNREDHNNPECGDAHLWNVWHGRQPFEWYRTSYHRFCSEFGFQSFPEPRSIEKFTIPSDRNVTSPVMEHHQRSGIGNTVIMQYMASWYRMPVGFNNTVWLSQIQQGMAMKYAIEHWRRNMPRCMGALIWQLNDCWPVASWASIDYYGRWKALHYMARHFFAPVLISGVEKPEDKTVEIHVSSDRLKNIKATARWIVTRVNGEIIEENQVDFELNARTTHCVKTLELADAIEEYGERDIMVWLELLDAKHEAVSTNFVSFVRPKEHELCKPGIKYTVEADPDEEGAFVASVESEHPALWVFLTLEGFDARLSDNWFHLWPHRRVKVTIRPEEEMTLRAVKKALKVGSLVDTYDGGVKA
ncbi:MAG: beta-mannosidase, partial [Candidatus Sumerlaeota bacterium]